MHYPTIRAYTQAIEIINQADALKTAFEDLDESTWLELQTKDKECFILTQIGTSIKNTQVRYYTFAFIKRIQSIIGLDLLTLTIDEPSKLWKIDDITQALADGEIKSHQHLFQELLVNIYGLSGNIINFIFGDRSRNALYAILSGFYTLSIDDSDSEKEALSVDFMNYLKDIIDNSDIYDEPFKVMG